jgi:hypothetical protein
MQKFAEAQHDSSSALFALKNALQLTAKDCHAAYIRFASPSAAHPHRTATPCAPGADRRCASFQV